METLNKILLSDPKIGDKICFLVEPMETIPPSDYNGRTVIAHVPKTSFQMCHYFDGSNVWKSFATDEIVAPDYWLRRVE